MVLLAGCSKQGDAPLPSGDTNRPHEGHSPESEYLESAFATLFSNGTERFLCVSGEKNYLIVNPSAVEEFQEPTRVLVEFAYSSAAFDKSRYNAAVLVATIVEVTQQPLMYVSADIGDTDESSEILFGAPMQIIFDWITTAEAGFLTVHYRIQQSGEVQHRFELRPFGAGGDYALYHNNQGDEGEVPGEGIICFRLLPEPSAPEGETPRIRLHYLDFSGKVKTLVLVYRSGS